MTPGQGPAGAEGQVQRDGRQGALGEDEEPQGGKPGGQEDRGHHQDQEGWRQD